MSKYLFTSESVTEGHPDKICDNISDAILDAILEQDPMGRVACETLTTTGMVTVMGEITTTAQIDIPSIVRKTVRDIGYTSPAQSSPARNNPCPLAQAPPLSSGLSSPTPPRGTRCNSQSPRSGGSSNQL